MKTATHVSSRTDRIFQTTQSVYRLSEPAPFGGEDEGIEGRTWFVLVSTTSVWGVGDPESHLETAVIPCLESGTRIGFSLLEVATDDKTAVLREFGYEVLSEDGVTAEAETKRATEDVTAALVRLVIDHAGSGDPEDAYEVTLFRAAEKAGVDLHAALLAHFERGN